jgi:hypothetical protein
VGWFAAKVRFRARPAGRSRSGTFEDSVFVFRSRSLPLARRRASAIAEALAAERLDVDGEGRKVRWSLERVHDVLEVGPAGLVDGAEIWRDRYARPVRPAGPREAGPRAAGRSGAA